MADSLQLTIPHSSRRENNNSFQTCRERKNQYKKGTKNFFMKQILFLPKICSKQKL